MRNMRKMHYMNPKHPLELKIANLKTLVYLRQVFVPGVKAVQLKLMMKADERPNPDAIMEVKHAYEEQRLKRDSSYSNSLNI
jgi:hypothetical protein